MRISMKNDLDLIRAILEEVESWEYADGKVVEVAEWPKHVVARHVERLCEDGLLDHAGTVPDTASSIEWEYYLVRDMSSRGHAFLGALRSEDIMARLKSALSPSQLAAMTMKEIAELAKELAMKVIRNKLGLDK